MIKVTDSKFGRVTEIDNVTNCYLDGDREKERKKVEENKKRKKDRNIVRRAYKNLDKYELTDTQITLQCLKRVFASNY